MLLFSPELQALVNWNDEGDAAGRGMDSGHIVQAVYGSPSRDTLIPMARFGGGPAGFALVASIVG